jgi:hypothetical protein
MLRDPLMSERNQYYCMANAPDMESVSVGEPCDLRGQSDSSGTVNW